MAFPAVIFPLQNICRDTRHAKDPDHGFYLVNGLTWMQKEERFCDVTLKIGKERKLRAHRVVLALSSRYFEACLGSNWEEARSDEVEIAGFDVNAVTNLVRFAYSGAIEITKDNVQCLLEASNYLGIEFVQNACTSFLAENLDADTCLGALQIADMLALEPLREDAKLYALRHFTDITMKQDFVNLPYHLLTELLKDEFLCVVIDDLIPSVEEREHFVIQAVFRYIEHDREKRADHLPQLLTLVRLPTLSKQILKEIAKHSLITSCRCEDIFDKAMRVKSHAESEIDSSNPKWAKIRDSTKCVLTRGATFGTTFPNSRQVQPETAFFTDKNVVQPSNDGVYIEGLTVWAHSLSADKQVISGIEVLYSDKSKTMYGVKTTLKQNEFHLKENEKIIKLEVQADTVIHGLTFYTNTRDAEGNLKAYRGFHSHGVTVRTERPPAMGFYGFLAGVDDAAVIDFQGLSGITQLQFAWKTYFLKSGGIPI